MNILSPNERHQWISVQFIVIYSAQTVHTEKAQVERFLVLEDHASERHVLQVLEPLEVRDGHTAGVQVQVLRANRMGDN